MTRRRLLLAIVATTLCGMAWWLLLDRLSSEERLLVGTWYRRVPPTDFWPGGAVYVHDFGPDRMCRIHAIDGRTGGPHLGPDGHPSGIRGRWRVRDGELVCDWDEGFVVRLRRALPAGFPGALPAATDNSPIEQLAADELVFRDRRGQVCRLTRALAE
jgi:hypothetical protein